MDISRIVIQYPERYVSTKEEAYLLLGVFEITVRAWVKAGQIFSRRPVGCHFRYVPATATESLYQGHLEEAKAANAPIGLLVAAQGGAVTQIVVAHRGCLARFGVDILEWVLAQAGAHVFVLHDSSNGASPEKELADLTLMAMVHVFSYR
jgi:predicted site-specific integrase-resolvase